MGKKIVENTPAYEQLLTEKLNMQNDVYWRDPKGGLFPEKAIKKEDKAREDVINKIVKKVYKLRELMRNTKTNVFAMADDYLDKLAKSKGLEKYHSSTASLINFRGNLKIEIDTADLIKFNENLNVAKMHIDEFIATRPSDDPILKSIIQQTFDTDGRVNRYMVLRLRKYRIPNEPESWTRAMKLIDESMEVYTSRRYIRIKYRDDTGNWHTFPLDWSDM